MIFRGTSKSLGAGARYLLSVALLIVAFLLHSISVASFDAHASNQSLYNTQVWGDPQNGDKDAAVKSIQPVGFPFAHEGTSVTIDVEISNNGSNEETIGVTLRDDTENVQIGTTEVTLAGGASTTVSFVWDTTGASGGPSPPGPPTPGTIHMLTATVSLEGDSDSANDSMSLIPGFWIIAAPTAPKITFPETTRAPQADYGADLNLDKPTISTLAEPISEAFFGEVHGRVGGEMSTPALVTEGEPLSSVFSSAVAQRAKSSASMPELSTARRSLSRIFRPGILSETEAVLANPGIATIAMELTRVLVGQVHARSEDFLLAPAISTEAEPLTRVLTDFSATRSSMSLTGAAIETAPVPLTETFASATDAMVSAGLARPELYTAAEALTQIRAEYVQARSTLEGSRPIIETQALPASEFFFSPMEAGSQSALTDSGIATLKEPLSAIYPGPVSGAFGAEGIQPELTTAAESLSELFVGGGAVTYQPAKPMQNPLEGAEIRGRVTLQSTSSSLGAYVEIAGEVTFAGRDGRFTAAAPAESFSLRIAAPGHLPVIVTGITLSPGQSLELPPVTLLFGDGNGDGVVDILDLSIAAINYGESASQLSAP